MQGFSRSICRFCRLCALLLAGALLSACGGFPEDPNAGMGGETPGAGTAQSGTLHVTGARLPTDAGRSELFRYPYLQQSSAAQLTVLWGTASDGDGELILRRADADDEQVLVATRRLFSDADTGIGSDFYQHEVALSQLDPGTEYRYALRHNGVVLAENVPLHTLPAADAATVSFVVFGDSGTEYEDPRAVRDAITSRDADGNLNYPHDFTIGVGDIAYNSGSYAEFNRNFFAQLSGRGNHPWEYDPEHGLLASRPFFASLGNHEYANDWQSLPAAYLDAFQYPTPAGVPFEDAERYYSFDAGPVHFAVLDSMKFAGNTSENRLQDMLDWLARDLADSAQPWKLVFLHHSFFSFGAHGTWGDMSENTRIRQQLLPILQSHAVRMVFFGHDHMYQRTQPISVESVPPKLGKLARLGSGELINEGGIVYVGCGNGGKDLHDRETEPSLPGSELFVDQQAAWGIGYDFLAERDGAPVLFDHPDGDDAPLEPRYRKGFTQVRVTREQIGVTAYNADGVVMDDFAVTLE
jgi:3',5'-cyclic AMP phosphodiesterase CpdA